MTLRTVGVLIALALISSPALADFFTFQQWAAMSELDRAVYIAGVFDSLVAPGGDDEQRVRAIRVHYSQCIGEAHMTARQLSENVLNYAKGRPEFHTGPVQDPLLNYLIAACGALPTK
jgi:hypothetical protein